MNRGLIAWLAGMLLLAAMSFVPSKILHDIELVLAYAFIGLAFMFVVIQSRKMKRNHSERETP
jgi:preprotein translocase subunit SecG